MMEQPNSRKCHRHVVFITDPDHIVIPHGSARLCDILYAALVCPLNVIAKREECVRAE